MISDKLKLKGRVSLTLRDSSGAIKESKEINNLVVDSGLDFITSRMTGTAEGIMSHMAIGAGTTAANANDEALESELGRVTLTDDAVSGAVITFTATFGAGTGTGAVTEAGLLNASSAGTMLCRTVFDVVNKAADDTLAITWTVTLTAS
jgi:hypothetical protein